MSLWQVLLFFLLTFTFYIFHNRVGSDMKPIKKLSVTKFFKKNWTCNGQKALCNAGASGVQNEGWRAAWCGRKRPSCDTSGQIPHLSMRQINLNVLHHFCRLHILCVCTSLPQTVPLTSYSDSQDGGVRVAFLNFSCSPFHPNLGPCLRISDLGMLWKALCLWNI